ncbi:hypothetical protein JL09_g5428 [Pichia kudriavzevii]|uniref:Uncharacterized protein n=1 Tax=Pichia kudriavzevii TaxID=4909 RepID=A0A099NU68_PICKU|nr:hypothetical protein JL09_g5428 [Pichia kudriavzevii]
MTETGNFTFMDLPYESGLTTLTVAEEEICWFSSSFCVNCIVYVQAGEFKVADEKVIFYDADLPTTLMKFLQFHENSGYLLFHSHIKFAMLSFRVLQFGSFYVLTESSE